MKTTNTCIKKINILEYVQEYKLYSRNHYIPFPSNILVVYNKKNIKKL